MCPLLCLPAGGILSGLSRFASIVRPGYTFVQILSSSFLLVNYEATKPRKRCTWSGGYVDKTIAAAVQLQGNACRFGELLTAHLSVQAKNTVTASIGLFGIGF